MLYTLLNYIFNGRTRKQEVRTKARVEIDILGSLSHPNVVRVFEVYEGRPETVIITELLSGGELFEKVSNPEFMLTEAEGAQFVKQICQGMAYIHDQVRLRNHWLRTYVIHCIT